MPSQDESEKSMPASPRRNPPTNGFSRRKRKRNPVSKYSWTPSPFTSSVAQHPVGPLGSSSSTPNIFTSSLCTPSNSMFGSRFTGLPAPSLFRSGHASSLFVPWSLCPTNPSIPFGSNTTMVASSFPLLSPPPFGTSTGLFGSSSSSATQFSSGTSLTLSTPVVTTASTTPSSSAMPPSFGNPPFGVFATLKLPLSSYLTHMSSEKGVLIKQIFERYGDITKESKVKSTEAKSAFLLLVVEAVERLRSYNLDSVDSHELDLIQQWTEDVCNLGFDLGWLEQKVAKFKYQSKLNQMKRTSEKVNGAKEALLEMEHQETILKKELDVLKSELDGMGGEDICSSNLSEGLV